jgi:hypothetical protein
MRIPQLVAPICRIDIDQNGTELEASECHHQPFRAILHPDSDSIALLDTDAQQAASKRIDAVLW